MTTISATTPLQVTVHPLQEQQGTGTPTFWSEELPTFNDMLDIINPLQHVPVVSTIYQKLTGDIPSSGANIIGGGLLGGPLGFFSSIIDEISKSVSGETIGGNVLAMLSGSLPEADAQTNSTPSPVNKAAYAAYKHSQNLLG